jgi:hypothetical protein
MVIPYLYQTFSPSLLLILLFILTDYVVLIY